MSISKKSIEFAMKEKHYATHNISEFMLGENEKFNKITPCLISHDLNNDISGIIYFENEDIIIKFPMFFMGTEVGEVIYKYSEFIDENKTIERFVELGIDEFFNHCKENNITMHKFDKFKKLQLMR